MKLLEGVFTAFSILRANKSRIILDDVGHCDWHSGCHCNDVPSERVRKHS